ncbi:MAG: hypothetical protein WBW49_18135, partial [Candidatus Acidiferrum sp.]
MARFLFTMLPANDLGLPTRMLPIARALQDRGHKVAMFNPAPAPSKLIADAGLENLPMPSSPMPPPAMDLAAVSSAWDVEEMFAGLHGGERYARASAALHVDLLREFAPDVVVDSFGLISCLAARILELPLASVLQGNFHPASDGFLWWKGQRPANLPSAAPIINKIAAEYGFPSVPRCV